jgi:SPP1 gp7 family putative phage head morphogenesis protein
MFEVCEHSVNELSVNVNRYDPTKTITLRNNFVHESNRRFKSITTLVYKMIVNKDVFGLKPHIHTLQEFAELPEKAFEFEIDAKKIEGFIQWLEEQVRKGLLDNWPNKYITDAYKRGILRALQEMQKAKYKVPLLAEIGGEDVILTLSPHINTLELLYLRTYSELSGITSQMEQQIARILAQGFVEGDGYKELANKLVAAINGKGMGELGLTDTIGRFIPAQRRAEILARTEIVRSHHLAMVQEFRRWGVKGVYIMAEWKTAGDLQVCPICASNEGQVYTLDEVEGMIPAHPNCRCCIVPVIFKQ